MKVGGQEQLLAATGLAIAETTLAKGKTANWTAIRNKP